LRYFAAPALEFTSCGRQPREVFCTHPVYFGKRLKMKGPRRISAQRILAHGSASPSNHDTLSQKQIASSWLVNLSEKRGLR
jgi:hypothetical protein